MGTPKQFTTESVSRLTSSTSTSVPTTLQTMSSQEVATAASSTSGTYHQWKQCKGSTSSPACTSRKRLMSGVVASIDEPPPKRSLSLPCSLSPDSVEALEEEAQLTKERSARTEMTLYEDDNISEKSRKKKASSLLYAVASSMEGDKLVSRPRYNSLPILEGSAMNASKTASITNDGDQGHHNFQSINGGSCISQLSHKGFASAACFHPNKHFLFTGSLGELYIWKLME